MRLVRSAALLVAAGCLSFAVSAADALVRDSTEGLNTGPAVLEWTMGPWGECSGNAGRVCGSTAGTQVRSVGCQMHPLDGS